MLDSTLSLSTGLSHSVCITLPHHILEAVESSVVTELFPWPLDRFFCPVFHGYFELDSMVKKRVHEKCGNCLKSCPYVEQ